MGMQITASGTSDLLFEIVEEVKKAKWKHPTNPTLHHSLSTIWEEFDELKDELRRQVVDPQAAKKEALHLITTAVRLIEEHLDPMIKVVLE